MASRKIAKIWKLLTRTMRRVRAITTPLAGIQFEPNTDTSFSRAQDEWELRHEIYLLAGAEAYRAKDGERRLRELMVPEVHAVETYLPENPEMRRLVERNIEAGTCSELADELREKRDQFRQSRLAEIGEVQKRTRNPEFDWMRQFERRVNMQPHK